MLDLASFAAKMGHGALVGGSRCAIRFYSLNFPDLRFGSGRLVVQETPRGFVRLYMYQSIRLRIQICSELDLYHVLGLPAATRRSLNREDAHVGILAIGRSPGALSVRDPAPPSIATDPRRNRRAARCGACLASMEELWPG